MKNSQTPKLLPAALLIACSGLTHAALIAETDFNSTTKSGASQTMTDIIWTGDDLISITPSTSATTVASQNAGYFTTAEGAPRFAPDQNTINEGPWAATFIMTLNAGASATLQTVSFDYQGLTNTGTSQGTFFHPHDFTVMVNGITFDSAKPIVSGTGSLAFTDIAAFNTGSNSIVITASTTQTTAGYNLAIDNLSLNGDVIAAPPAVPEPGSLALLSLAGLFFARRRVRTGV